MITTLPADMLMPAVKHQPLFQLELVAQGGPFTDAGDTCKETCKLECHSGAPVIDADDEEDYYLI